MKKPIVVKKKKGNKNSDEFDSESEFEADYDDDEEDDLDFDENLGDSDEDDFKEIAKNAKNKGQLTLTRNSNKDKKMSLEKISPKISKKIENEVSKKASSRNTSKSKAKPNKIETENMISGGPLEGQIIVITGLLNCVDDKKDLQELIKILGGKSPGSVSAKSTMLIAGHILPDGRETSTSGKYKKAKEKKVKIINEEDFEALLLEKTQMTIKQLLDGGANAIALGNQEDFLDHKKIEKKEKSGNKTAKKAKESKIHDLWTDKYAPADLDSVIGNQGVIAKLRTWLEDW